MITPAQQIAEGGGGSGESVVYVFIGHQFARLGEGHNFFLQGRALRLEVIYH